MIILASLAMSSCRNNEEDVYSLASDNDFPRSVKKGSDTILTGDSISISNPHPPKPPIKGHHWRP